MLTRKTTFWVGVNIGRERERVKTMKEKIVYTHRNGEAKAPTAQGYYWAKWENLIEKEIYFTVVRQDAAIFSWGPEYTRLIAVYGPIPEPKIK